MTDGPASQEGAEATFTVPGSLSPADAPKVCDELKKCFESAQAAGTAFSLDLDGEATPCALQLLIAATRSATASGVGLEVSENARDVFTGIALEIARK